MKLGHRMPDVGAMTGRPDPQRRKVYTAEREAQIVTRGPLSFAKARSWFAFVLTKPAFQDGYGVWQVVLEPLLTADGSGAAEAGLAQGKERVAWVRIDPTGTTKGILLHELAHALADARGAVHHDGVWVLVYLDLVRLMFGARAEDALRAAFRRHGVSPCAG